MPAEYQQTAVYEDLYKIPDNMIGQIIGGELFAMPRPVSETFPICFGSRYPYRRSF